MPDTLLLADDSATIQRVIEMTFAEEDIRVVAVGDGREAIERIVADPPDIVLADTNMPEKDGYDVSAFVKSDSALAHIPVVLLTGAFDPVDGDRAREAGCDAVLVKPFEPKAVLHRVRELLGTPVDPAEALAAVGAMTDPEPVLGDAAADPRSGDVAQAAGPPSAPSPPEAPASGTPPALWDSAKAAASDPQPVGAAGADPASPSPPAADSTPSVPAVPAVEAPAPPSLADAFASLLAAEQGDLDRARAAYPWPRQIAPVREDDLIERVTERVVERLSDDVTGELVSEVVARVAERLVRDQIGRIKRV